MPKTQHNPVPQQSQDKLAGQFKTKEIKTVKSPKIKLNQIERNVREKVFATHKLKNSIIKLNENRSNSYQQNQIKIRAKPIYLTKKMELINLKKKQHT